MSDSRTSGERRPVPCNWDWKPDEAAFSLVLRRGVYYVHGSGFQGRIRVSTRTGDLAKAQIMLEDLQREHTTGWLAGRDHAGQDWQSVAKWVCQRHRTSAKERGIAYDITAFDVYRMMQETGFRCSVSGIAYSKRVGADGPADPWSPSIDRIENKQGYLKDNIRVVCLMANIAMNRWGYDALLRLSKAVVREARRQAACDKLWWKRGLWWKRRPVEARL